MEFNATFIVSAISFIIFTIIMNKILYKPIFEIIEARENYFLENKNNVEKSEKSILKLLEEKDNKIKEADRNACLMLLSGKNKLSNEKTEKINTLKQDLLEKSKEEKDILENEKTEVYNNIRSDIDVFANSIVNKLLNQSVNQNGVNDKNV